MGLMHNIGQVAGHALNVLPGYSTLGANITNPNINFKGALNPPTPSNNFYTPPAPVTKNTDTSGGDGGGGAAPNNSGVYTGGGSGTDPLAAARAQYGDPSQYDAQIQAYNGQIGGLQGQEAVGLQNNANGYQLEHNRLGDEQAGSEKQYNTGIQQNTQTYQNNRTKTLNASRSNAQALQRLLGINGAGNSSAAYEQAPYAAALQGSQDIGEAQQTFGMNAQNLDTGWQDTQRKYKNAFDDLSTQKFQGDNSVKSNIAQSRADLLDKIATASVNRNLANGQTGGQAQAGRNQYQPEIDSLLQQITSLGKGYANPVIAAKSVDATPVQLSDYAQGRRLVAQNQPAAGNGDIASNFLPFLAQKRDDLYGTPQLAY